MRLIKLSWVFIITFNFTGFTYAQNFEWLKVDGTKSAHLYCAAMCANADGSATYLLHHDSITNYSQDTFNFGTYQFVKPMGNDRASAFLVTRDSNGNVTKAIQIGIIGSQSLVKDDSGNYYVSVVLPYTNKVGSLSFDRTKGRFVVIKYDKNLNLIYAVQGGSYYSEIKLFYSNHHLYFIVLTTGTIKLGSTTYSFSTGNTHVYGEINPLNGSILWSNYLYDTPSSVLFEIVSMVNLNNKLFINGNVANKEVIINSDTFYSPGIFIVQTDSNGKYKKRVSLRTKKEISTMNIATDGKYIYFCGYFKDTIVWGNKKISPNNGGSYMMYVASMNSDLKPRWFFRPEASKSVGGGGTVNILRFSNGYLYCGGKMGGQLIINGSLIDGRNLDVIVFKMDYLGNVLWATNGGTYGLAGAMDAFEKKYVMVGGHFVDKYIKIGKFIDSSLNSKIFTPWVVRISDYEITRGKVSAGPYCAGDTINVPYTKIGKFDTSNVFIAELSNEEGNFDGGQHELGRLKSNQDGVVKGILPMFQVSSSPLYRIRIRSTKPAIQSYYVIDTLRLLIYSRDKANPGLPETICMGDSLKLNTYGGTKWTWSPKYNMDNPTKRQPIVWPTKDTTYRIIIADSSGCGAPDTAFKKVFVRPYPKAILKFNDTIVCGTSSLKVPISFVGGDSNYKWQWHFVYGPKSWFPSVTGQNKLHDTLNYQPTEPNEKLAIILKDGCTSKPDTAYLIISQRQKVTIKSSYKDTSLCSGHKLKYKTIVTGGVSKYIKYQWKDLITNSILSNSDSLAFTTSKTEKIQLIVNDGCEALGDTAEFKVEVKAKLRAQSNLRDTSLCFGKNLNLSVKAIGGDSIKYTFSWLLDKKIISSSNSLVLKTEDHFLTTVETKKLSLVLKDNCSLPNDSVIKTITVKPAPKANFSYDLACSRTITNFQFTGNKPSSPITTTFNWDFNKESSSTLENPSKLFATIGTKKIKLTATSNNGCIDTLTKAIDIKFQSQADFTVNDVCQSDSALFINKSIDATGYNWKFGDGKNSNLKTPKHKYQITSTTTYNVTLVAIVQDGCSDSISKPLTINELPNSDFSITKVNQTVYVKANKNGLVSYKWVKKWKDGSKDSITKNTNTHNYTYHENIKNICLTATDNLGCQSQTCKDPSTASGKPINAIPIAIGIKIYPNPASESITIETDGLDNQNFSIQMINSLGQIVPIVQNVSIAKNERREESQFEYSINNNQYSTFNIQNLSEGVYLIRVLSESKVWNHKVLVSFGGTPTNN